MPETPIAHITPRHEGCEAVPDVKGTDFSLPICMGGTALVGCNKPDQCMVLYDQRIKDPISVHVIFRSEDRTRITRIMAIPRQTLLLATPEREE